MTKEEFTKELSDLIDEAIEFGYENLMNYRRGIMDEEEYQREKESLDIQKERLINEFKSN